MSSMPRRAERIWPQGWLSWRRDDSDSRWDMARWDYSELEENLLSLPDHERQQHVIRHQEALHEIVARVASHGNRSLLELLLKPLDENETVKVLKKQCINGRLPVHHCLRRGDEGQLECLRYLLSRVSADNRYDLLTAYSSSYYNSLHMAAKHNNAQAAHLLISSLSPDERYWLVSKVGGYELRTVLDMDISKEFRAMVVGLVIAQPDKPEIVPAVNQISLPRPAWPSSPTPFEFNMLARNPRSALSSIDPFLEFIKCDSDGITLLLECRDADNGRNLLHIVAADGRMDIMRKIFQAMKSLAFERKRALVFAKSLSGKTALHYAAQYDRAAALQEILYFAETEDRALVNVVDNQNRRADFYASEAVRRFLAMVETSYWRVFSIRPIVLVFYNTFAGDPIWRRDFAVKEKDNVVCGFKAQGIEPEVYGDLPGPDIVRIIRGVARAVEDGAPRVSALIILLMSHGGEGVVYDGKKNPLRISSLITLLQMEALRSIPKVLMIQACRNLQSPRASRLECGGCGSGQGQDPVPSAQNPRLNQAVLERHVTSPDLTVIYATLPGRPALQNFFLKVLADVLRDNATVAADDLVTMVMAANRRMSDNQHATSAGMLSRRLYLRDPLERQPLLARLSQKWRAWRWG